MSDIFDELMLEQPRQAEVKLPELPKQDVFDELVAEEKQAGDVESSYASQALGSFIRGGMKLGQAILELPKHAAGLAVLAGGGIPEEVPGGLLERERLSEEAKKKADPSYKSGAEKYVGMIERHKAGQEAIIKAHPEWEYEPPKNFLDLLTSPRKLSLAIIESAPVLLAAGVATAAGAPSVAVAMMYAVEGQEAKDQAIADGRTELEAEAVYHMYGSVAAIIENLQLKQIMRTGKSSFNAVLNRTVQKTVGKSLTREIVEIAAKEALEEISQGTWREATAKLVYGKTPEGGLIGFIDRRAQEGLIGFTMGIIPGVGGMAAGKVAKGKTPVKGVEDTQIPTEEVTEERRDPTNEKLRAMFDELRQRKTSLANRDVIEQAVKEGIPVTKELLSAFEGEKWADKAMAELEKKDVVEGKVEGITPPSEATVEKIKTEMVRVPEEDVALFDNLRQSTIDFNKKRVSKSNKAKIIANTKEIKTQLGRKGYSPEFIKAIQMGDVGIPFPPLAQPKPVAEPLAEQKIPVEKPIKKAQRMSRSKALRLGHQLPKIMGWDEKTRRAKMQEIIGKDSMKDMSYKERGQWVDYAQAQIREAGLGDQIGEEKAEKREKIVIGETLVDIAAKLDEAVDSVNELKPLHKAKGVVTRKASQLGKGLFHTAKDLTIGVDNDNIGTLSRYLSGGKENSITEILDTNKQYGVGKMNSHYKGGAMAMRSGMEDAGITSNDLIKMSRSNDPRMEIYKTVTEVAGKPRTTNYNIKLNDRTYRLSMANLMDIYLMSQQEDGIKHAIQSGLEIFGQKTGPLAEDKLAELIEIVESDEKAKAISDIMTDISVNVNSPAMNNVSNRMDPEDGDIATENKYWHLEIAGAKRLAGKGAISISFLENKGLFMERTKSGKGALVVRDAFDRFNAVQMAVSEYVGMAEPLRAMRTLLNYEPFIAATKDRGYNKVRDNIIEILDNAQTPTKVGGSVNRILSSILRGAYRAVLVFNPRVITSQYMSTIQYAGIVDAKYIKNIGHFSSPATIKEMLNKNAVAWSRFYMGHQSIAMAELGQIDSTLRLMTGKSADVNKAGIAMSTADIMALADGWKIAKAIVADEGVDKSSTKYWGRVNEIAEDLWVRTQPSWDKWNRSVNTANPTALRQTIFLFRSYYEKALSMLHRASAEYEGSGKTAADKAKMAKVYGAVIASQFLTATIRGVVSWKFWAGRKTIWDFLADIAAAPLGMVAVIGKWMQVPIKNFIKILGNRKTGYSPTDSTSLPGGVINKFLELPDDFGKAVAYLIIGEDEKAKREFDKAISSGTEAISIYKGVPYYEIKTAMRELSVDESGTKRPSRVTRPRIRRPR